MGNYKIFEGLENPRRVGSKKFYNKCSENSRSQIVFRTDIFKKSSLGSPDVWRSGACFSKDLITFKARRQTRFSNQIRVKSSIVPKNKPVNFAALTDSLTVSFSKLLKL